MDRIELTSVLPQDALDIFGEHGVGGIVGNLLTSFFAA